MNTTSPTIPVNPVITNDQYHDFVGGLFKKMPRFIDEILHASIGMSGEAGELLDCVKKNWAYEKPLDFLHLREEAGDLLFYLVALCNVCGWRLDEVMFDNHIKLSKRYSTGVYSDAQAQARADKVPPPPPPPEEAPMEAPRMESISGDTAIGSRKVHAEVTKSGRITFEKREFIRMMQLLLCEVYDGDAVDAIDRILAKVESI